MHFAFTEEQEELRETARAFLAECSSSERVRRAMASELGYEPDVWKRVGTELGWPAVIVPESCGGLDLGAVELVALLEVMGERLFCAPFFSTVCLAVNALCAAATEEQQRAWLPALAEGRETATLAFCEAGGRWDVDAVTTRVRRDGEGYVLDGCKRYVLDGHSADWLLVAAREDGSTGDEGVSLLRVSGRAEGVTATALPTMDQTRRLAQVELRGVQLGADACVGRAGAAAPALRQALDRAAIALAAEQVGGAQACLEASVQYAKERVQFGRPIGSFQAIQHKCADMMVAVESARSAVYYAACVAAEETPELSLAASLAKTTASEAFFRCAAESIQIHGGVGFTWEYDVHLYFKRARAGEHLLGTPDQHRERVARELGF